MTCIVGIEDGPRVWMGGDSAQTDTHCDRVVGVEPKVFIKDGVIFGCTGSIRMKQVLRHHLVIPEQTTAMSDEAWLCGPLVDSIRDLFRKSGLMRTKDGSEEADGCMLVGYRGCLYVMECGFALIRSNRGWETAGSGAPYASGALATLASLEHTVPRNNIMTALEAAAACNASVCAPFTILQQRGTL